jgi:PhnB protein
MQVTPHVTFNGQCEAAFQFYEKRLGGKVLLMMTYGDSSMAGQAPPHWQNKILHASFSLGATVFSGGDAPPDVYRKPQGFSLSLHLDNAVEADRIFNALSENGEVQMPLQETFWALRFGMLIDQFGVPWMINCSGS